MSLPQLSVRVAFASNPYDPTLTWTEIGPASGAGPGGRGWVRELTTKRGRERLLRANAQFQAGSLSGSLDNRDRRFDPTNTSSPYSPNVQPEKVIQVGATWQSVFYPIWTGYVDDWPQSWPGFSEGECPIVATDLFKALAIARVLSSGYQKQVIADGASAFWRLNDPAGATRAAESVTAANYLTPTGGVTFGGAGASPASPDTSVALDGNPGSHLTVPTADIVASATSFSVEVWVNITAVGSAFAWSQDNLSLKIWTGGGLVVFNVAGTVATSTAAVGDGNWHHIVGTWNQSTGTAIVYVDGVSSGTATAAVASWTTALQLWGEIVTAGKPNGSNYQGSLQWAALYAGTVLSATQVANHYQLAAFRAQYSGSYVNQVMLNMLAYPARLLSVDTGHSFCQADTQSEVNTKVLDFLQQLERSEQGQCFVDASGVLNFQDRYHRYKNPNNASQATIGDGGGAFPSEIPFAMGGVTLNFDRVELFNDVIATRRGGNPQEASDAASITSYGNRCHPGLDDLLLNGDISSLYAAQWILADTKQPQFRVGQLVIDPRVDDRWWPVVLGLDIGAVVTVNKHNIPGGGPAVSLVCRIEGIEHQITPPNGWAATWHVSLSGTNPWLILDDPVTGLLDHGNRYGW